MSSLSTILNIVLKGERNFCCLCFNTDVNITQYHTHDKLTLDFNETERSIDVKDMLQSVLGTKIEEYLVMFENICEACIRSIYSVYTFIQQYQQNAMLLIKALDGLSNSIEFAQTDIEDSQSLFLTLNSEDFTSKHIYDSEKLDSTKEALKRFIRLNSLKKKETERKRKECTNKEDSSQSKAKTKCRVNIKVSDMLLDSNDIKCKDCFKAFRTLQKLKIHYLKAHTSKKCAKTQKKFNSANVLADHKNENHCKVICSHCGKTLKNRASLTKHELDHHLIMVCPDCGCSYENKIIYTQHIDMNMCKRQCRASPATAKYTCDYCGKKYTQKMSLRVHIQYEHGNYTAHVCEWCGKKFWAQSRLKAHIVKHTREKNFTCSVCQGKFFTKQSLLYHTRLHTGEKPYRCTECQCTFVSASRRAYHMKTYHLHLSVECEICHSKFTSLFYLVKHMKSHKLEMHDATPANKDENQLVYNISDSEGIEM